MRKVLWFGALCLGLVACLSLAVKVIYAPVTSVPRHSGPAVAVRSSRLSRANRAFRRWSRDLSSFCRRIKSAWQQDEDD